MKAAKQIKNKLQKEGRTKAWLASQIGVTRQHMSLILNEKTVLTEDNLKSINKILQTEF
jgi:plasmid maintenance system antidote protein VapI